MRKTLLLLTTGGIFLLLVGAGCSTYTGTDSSVSTDDQTNDQQTATDTTDTDQTPASTTDITATASLEGANMVKVSWTTPTKFDSSSNVRVIYGPQANPEYGKAYWYQRSSNTFHDAIIPGVKIGQMHFRVCEFKNNACVRYSNDVVVDVKG